MTNEPHQRACRRAAALTVLAIVLGMFAPEARANFVQFAIPANADVVAESSAPAPSGLDSAGAAFMSAAEAAARAPGGQVGHGLPDNGQFTEAGTGGTIQLLPYTGSNVVRLSGPAGGGFTVNVTPAQYQSLTIYATCGDSSGALTLGLNYSDGTVNIARSVNDWFVDPPPAGSAYLIDGLDRTQPGGTGFQDSNDPAIFAIPISPDQTRTLESITITRTSTADTMNIFALTGNTMLSVTTTDDHDDGVCSESDCTLREAIIAANSLGGADTITFAAGVTGTIQLASALPNLSSDITISGPGAGNLTVSGNNAFRVFTIAGGDYDVAFSDLTIANGTTTSDNLGGAGVLNFSSGEATLTSCTFSGNQVTFGSGGGFAQRGDGAVTITSCSFESNVSLDNVVGFGGALSHAGTGNVSVSASTFTGNTCQNSGGAIGNLGGGTLEVDDCTFTSNVADSNAGGSGYGGGVDHTGSGTVTVSNCTFNTNSAANGGSLSNQNGTLNVSDSTIAGGSASNHGGGIINTGSGIITVTGSAITGNRADANMGGTGDGAGVFNDASGTINLNTSTLSGNTAVNGGGVVNRSTGTINLATVTLSGNSALDNAGGVYNVATGAVNMTNSTVTNNRADFENNASGAGGGVRNITTGPVTLHNTIVAANFAQSSGTSPDDVNGAVANTSSFNLIGVDTGLSGISHGTNGNQIGTAAAPIDARLNVLSNNGGPTRTHGLQSGSPAIDKGDDLSASNTTDQRGLLRPFDDPAITNAGDGSDIGAFEAHGSGELAFSAPSYAVMETAGNASITVRRTGGTDTDVVAKVTLTDGTTSPADYRFTPGVTDPTFNSGGVGADTPMYAVAIQPDGKIVIGGFFANYNGEDAATSDDVMRLSADGTRDPTFNAGGAGANNVVTVVALQLDGKIVIGGAFTSYNQEAAASDRIMRLNADGTRDATFNAGGAGANDTVLAVAVQPDGKIIVGGFFTSYNGDAGTSEYVMRLNADGTRDPTFNAGGTGTNAFVAAATVQPDGKIVIGGGFTGYNGDLAATNDFVMRLNVDGTRDSTFNAGGAGADSNVNAVALQPDGKIIIGGLFGSYNGEAAATSDRVMRLNADGTRDPTFNPGGAGADNNVAAVAVQPDGKILIGGFFTSYNSDGATSDGVMRLNADGTPDTTFNAGGAGADSFVNAVALQPDGKIIIGGLFGSYNGDAAASNFIMRLEGDLFITWPAGDATDKAFQLPIINDALAEEDETLTLTLTLMSGGATLGTPSSSTLTILDDEPRAVTPAPAPFTNEDTSVQITLTGTDRDDAPLTFTITDPPDHGLLGAISPPNCGAVNTCTATVTYTPAQHYNGADSFAFTVNDGGGTSNAATVSIAVNAVNDAPIADAQSVTANEDTAVAVTLTGSDVEGSALTFTIVDPPTHGILSGTESNLIYTPAANYNGLDSFTFKSNDGALDSNVATVSITVNAVNDAPVANAQAVTTDEDTAKGIILTGSDVDGTTPTFSVVAQPTSGTLSGTPPNLTYTPNANYDGADSFTFKASDGTADSNVATVSITVTAINDTPTVDAQSVTTDEDTATAITLAGSDADADALSFTVVTNPAHGTLSGTAPNLTYTPTGTYSGADSFTFKASDGTADSNLATVSITVTAVNDAPTATGQSVTTNEDTPKAITLAGSDIEGDGLSFSIVASPAHGSLSGTPPNVTYTPHANYAGPDSFTFKAHDGSADSAAATVSITVAGLPEPQTLNISTRVRVETGDRVMIAGTIITGNAAKKVIIRAIGPSLASSSIVDALADPVLELYGADGVLMTSNDNWKDTQQAEIEASNLAPTNDNEAAIVATLMPGNYTAVVRGKDNTAGVGLAEIYDLDTAADSRLANISTRGFVQTGQNVMIGGFVLGGNTNTGSVIIRGLGPSLTQNGVANALIDPTLELRDKEGNLIRANDNWQDDTGQSSQITGNGVPPENALESALVATLPAGQYTAILAGKNSTSGIGLVEIYNLP